MCWLVACLFPFIFKEQEMRLGKSDYLFVHRPVLFQSCRYVRELSCPLDFNLGCHGVVEQLGKAHYFQCLTKLYENFSDLGWNF